MKPGAGGAVIAGWGCECVSVILMSPLFVLFYGGDVMSVQI